MSVPGRWSTSQPYLRTSVLGAVLLAACASGSVLRNPSPASIERMERAVAASPASIDPRLHLAAAYRGTGRPAMAIAVLEPVAAEAADDPAVQFLLASSYQAEQRHAEARRAFAAYAAAGGTSRLNRAARARLVLLERLEMEEAVRSAIAQESSLGVSSINANALGVFPFLYGGADAALAPLGRALAELLSTDLAQTDRLRVVERARVQFLLDELRLSESGATDPATAVRAGKMVGAGRIMQGRVTGETAGLAIQAALVQAAGGPQSDVAAQRGSINELFDLEKQLALSVYAGVGVQLTAAERERVLQRHTDNVQALLAFGDGLAADDSGRYAEAVAAFERSLEADGGFDLARFWLEQAKLKQEATAQDDDELAGLAELDLGWFLPDWQRRRLPFISIDPLVPDPDLRNPAPELVGVEGLDRRALVDIVVRPPGGGK